MHGTRLYGVTLVVATALCLVTPPLHAQTVDIAFGVGMRTLTDDPEGSGLFVLDARATLRPSTGRIRPELGLSLGSDIYSAQLELLAGAGRRWPLGERWEADGGLGLAYLNWDCGENCSGSTVGAYLRVDLLRTLGPRTHFLLGTRLYQAPDYTRPDELTQSVSYLQFHVGARYGFGRGRK